LSVTPRCLNAGGVTTPLVYLSFSGTAREALRFYADVSAAGFPCIRTRTSVATARQTPSHTACSTASLPWRERMPQQGEKVVKSHRFLLSLLGAADPEVLHEWFNKLAVGGRAVDPLAPKPGGVLRMARSSTVMGFIGLSDTNPNDDSPRALDSTMWLASILPAEARARRRREIASAGVSTSTTSRRSTESPRPGRPRRERRRRIHAQRLAGTPDR
jgi:PhnB protein